MKKRNQIKKQIAIWMDHEKAQLIEPVSAKIKTVHQKTFLHSGVAGEKNGGSRLGNFRSTNNEFTRHNKEQDHLHAFYKDLAHEIMSFDEILILGPSTARKEFQNYLDKDKHFEAKKITNEACDYLSDNRIQERVYSYFKNSNE